MTYQYGDVSLCFDSIYITYDTFMKTYDIGTRITKVAKIEDKREVKSLIMRLTCKPMPLVKAAR